MSPTVSLSLRWMEAPRELVDMVLEEVVLTPLKITAPPLHPRPDHNGICAVYLTNWRQVLSMLQLNSNTRKNGLQIIQQHGALEIVPVLPHLLIRNRSLHNTPHWLLRYFGYVFIDDYYSYRIGDLYIRGQARVFVNTPGPPRLKAITRIEMNSQLDPRLYSKETQAKLMEDSTSESAKTAKRNEDRGLMASVVDLCRSRAWYRIFREYGYYPLERTLGSADDVRRLIVW